MLGAVSRSVTWSVVVVAQWVLEPRTVGIFRKIWEDYEKM
jgi:hypothetical protein